MLTFPAREAWTVYTFDECPEGDYLGGYALVSKGRSNSPLTLTYGWNGNHYFYEIALVPSASLISMSDRPSEVAHASSEQEAVNLANEHGEGVADIVNDVAHGLFGVGNVIVLLAGEIPGVQLDQNEEAIAFLTRKTKELIQ